MVLALLLYVFGLGVVFLYCLVCCVSFSSWITSVGEETAVCFFVVVFCFFVVFCYRLLVFFLFFFFFLFEGVPLCMLRRRCVILLWDFLCLPYNYFFFIF